MARNLHDEILTASLNQQRRSERLLNRTGTVISVMGSSAMVRLGGSGTLTPVQCDPYNLPHAGDTVSLTRAKDTALWTVSSVQKTQQPSGVSYARSVIVQQAEVNFLTTTLTPTINVAATQVFGYYIDFTTPADGASWDFDFSLAAGTYTVSVYGRTASGAGKIDWYLDDALISSGQDWYQGTGTANTVKTFSITLTTDGLHTLMAIVNGKNGSSGGYNIQISNYFILPA
jgi:hypothetical protein